MDILVFGVMLVSAALHATWNAWVKSRTDSTGAVSALVIGAGIPNIAVLALLGVPGLQAWGWIAVTVALSIASLHLIAAAYGEGDFAVAYPLIRGLIPVVMTLAAIPLFGERPSLAQGLGVLCVSGGLGVVAWESSMRSRTMTLKGVGLAVITAGFTALAALTDAMGARLSESAFSYAATISVLNGVFMAIFQRARGHRVGAMLGRHWPILTFGACLSVVSYTLYIWALTRAPVGLVAALRETSMVFAILIAAWALRERIGLWRWGAVAVMFAGMMLIRL
ncbi:MAG: DMT family transporter [Pseudomonadota bacterium]|nr:DMT family transporter [Pseudomonadota bacterium]